MCAAHLRIVQITDTQLGFTDSQNRWRAAQERSVPEDELELHYSTTDRDYYERAIAQINGLAPAPDVVINTGDLVDAPDNPAQWADYLRITATINFPVYEVMGNHDGFSEQGLAYYRHTLKKRDAYSFRIKGVYFVVLNSQFLKEPGRFPAESAQHRAFVETALAENRAVKHKILLMHHPLFFEAPDEDEAYFSLPPAQRQWALRLIKQYSITAILSGHYHRNHIAQYKNAALITSGPVSEAMGSDSDGKVAQRGFRVIDLDRATGEITHNFFTLQKE